MAKLQANYKNILKKKDHEVGMSDEEAAYKDLIASGSSSDQNDELSENGDEGCSDREGGEDQAMRS